MSDSHTYWLAIARVQKINIIRLRQIVESFSCIDLLFNATTTDLLNKGLSLKEINLLKAIDERAIEKDKKWLQEESCHLLPITKSNYPKLLKEISDAPLVLFVKGKPEILHQPQIAIVGSRNPTSYGSKLAYEFAKTLSEAGLVITSGLAIGVDGESHKGALAAENTTIAVTGCGLKTIYPPRHKSLGQQIIQNGAIVTEFPPDVLPIARNFPLRNRIISGLSLGTVVIEAAARSGSLITARLAAEQGREVFAIPGSIYNQQARGCHHLIRQGAKLIEGPQDVLEEISQHFQPQLPSLAINETKNKLKLTKKEQEFLFHIGYHPTPLDFIIQQSGLTASEVSSMLLVLELRGYVESVPGGYALLAQ